LGSTCLRRNCLPDLSSSTSAKPGAPSDRTVGRCVARTIAVIEGADLIDTPHIAWILQYRKRDGE
jgi:hypothetical protein